MKPAVLIPLSSSLSLCRSGSFTRACSPDISTAPSALSPYFSSRLTPLSFRPPHLQRRPILPFLRPHPSFLTDRTHLVVTNYLSRATVLPGEAFAGRSLYQRVSFSGSLGKRVDEQTVLGLKQVLGFWVWGIQPFSAFFGLHQ